MAGCKGDVSVSRQFARELTFTFLLLILLVLWGGIFIIDLNAGSKPAEVQCRIIDIELDENAPDERIYRVVIRMNRRVDYEVVRPSASEPKVLVKLPQSTELPESLERQIPSGLLKRLSVAADAQSHTVVELELRSSDVDVTDDRHGDSIHLQLHSRGHAADKDGFEVVGVF